MNNKDSLKEHTVRKFIEWLFQVKTTEKVMIKGSLTVFAILASGKWLLPILLSQLNAVLPAQFHTIVEQIDALSKFVFTACLIALLIGIYIAVRRFKQESAEASRKRVIVIEGRGLRDDDGSPLLDAVPASLIGQRIPILLDLRQRQDGKIINPAQLLGEIHAVHNIVRQQKASHDRRDLTIAYGGLTSVPFTFLTGVLFDDESPVLVWDWDPTIESWRAIENQEDDDNEKFISNGIDDIKSAAEVVLAISFSYLVSNESIATSFSQPIVSLRMPDIRSGAHWSLEKQRRLSSEFLEFVKALGNKGVKKIHLVMAAPNSVVFNFGRRYDKRNFPELVAYQYENGQCQAYPWGIAMPVAATQTSSIVCVDHSKSVI